MYYIAECRHSNAFHSISRKQLQIDVTSRLKQTHGLYMTITINFFYLYIKYYESVNQYALSKTLSVYHTLGKSKVSKAIPVTGHEGL
jgi:hypothetical protein